MTLSLGLSPWLLLLCLIGAGGLTYWTYRVTVPPVSTGRRWVLGGLRFVTLFLTLFLLFEPILRRLDRDTQPPVLAVLIDTSQSLGLRADSTEDAPRDLAETVRATIDQLPQADVDGTLRFYTFDADVRPRPDDPLDTLRFEGGRTDIARALEVVRERHRTDNLGGVLLVSDGQYNTGRNPLHVAERYPVPIHTVVVGDTTRRRDVQVRRVTTNEIGYVGTEVPVQVGLRVEDYGGERVTVTLLRNGQVLDTETVTLPEGTAEVPTDLAFTPEAPGLQRLQAAVSRLDGEATYRNNSQAFTVRVLESKKRILLLGAAPSPDLSAIRQVLEQDPNASVSSYVQKGPGTFYEGPVPADLDSFDVAILAGFPGQGADAATIERVAAAAEEGLPLLFLLSRQTDLSAYDRAFGDLLPAAPELIRGSFVEAAFDPTQAGVRHPVLEIDGVDLGLVDRLPPLRYNESRWAASPDAQVLATTIVRGVPLDDPLLAVRSRSGYRSAALLGTGTWRWKNVPTDLQALEPFWPGLFSNLLQWVGTRVDDRLVRVEPVADLFGGDERVAFAGQVYDESLTPLSDASVQVDVTAPDSTRLPYTMESVGNGRYVLDVGSLPEGTYRYAATATRNGTTLGTDRGTFAVGGLTLEFKETRADVALLRQLAQRSGGSFFEPSGLTELPTRLAGTRTFTPVTLEEEQTTELRRVYAFLVVILLCLTTEWFLRKRSGMV